MNDVGVISSYPLEICFALSVSALGPGAVRDGDGDNPGRGQTRVRRSDSLGL
ncbi:hypothetical protein DFR69_107302 [Nocardia neocaledoniensis]|uniref:Uncharacterized protein n=1 Tax=Nocardia neocaledoniensis TaxID=236511 RepID=A0A317NET7_9NOCA|nr:hypothetical protein DFR69_107302 [Nocardia neocaledoniensis]